MKKGVTALFYLNYARNTARRDRFRRRLATAACAGAVAFTAMCAGYLGEFSDYLQEQMQTIFDRSMIVANTTGGAPLSDDLKSMLGNCPISKDDAEGIKKIAGVESAEPVVIFPSHSSFSKPFMPSATDDDYDESAVREALINRVKLTNADGLSKQIVLNCNMPEKLNPGDVPIRLFYALSYPSRDYMEYRCSYVDDTVDAGGYISKEFAETLGITQEHLKGLTIEIEMMVPVCRQDGFSLISSGEEEMKRIKSYHEFYSRDTIRFEVRGIYQDENTELETYYIYLPSHMMLNQIEKIKDEKMDEAEEYISVCNQIFAESQGESKIAAWSPNTYYIIAEDLAVIDQIQEGLTAINPNFVAIHKYQNIVDGLRYVSNHRNVMVYISLAVLAVVFLLTALVYVSLIDKRKYEFAVLRANGLTKREVRRVVYAEMALQFALIFVAGLLFAGLIFFIGGRWLGYPFQFDGMTILWLFLISLGAVVLPTIISLLFVNKFEPDRVMRN